MTKPKTLERLRAEKERAETQLAQEKHKLITIAQKRMRDKNLFNCLYIMKVAKL